MYFDHDIFVFVNRKISIVLMKEFRVLGSSNRD